MTYKLPEDCKGFYQRFNVEAPLSPEDEAEKQAAADEEAKKGKDKKKDKKPDKGKGKKKGKKGDDDDGPAIVKIGITETVQKFDENYDDFNLDWATRDETANYKQEYDVELAKTEVMPLLEKEYKQTVDDMIKMELDNMRLLSGAKGKKKKKGKGKKKGKKKKKKKLPKLPGFKAIGGFEADPRDSLMQLINHNIVRRLPQQNLSDFMGEFNYIHSMLDDIK